MNHVLIQGSLQMFPARGCLDKSAVKNDWWIFRPKDGNKIPSILLKVKCCIKCSKKSGKATRKSKVQWKQSQIYIQYKHALF